MAFDPNKEEKKPETKEMTVVRRKTVIDPEFIESHPVKQDYMQVTLRKARLSKRNEQSGMIEEQGALVQPLGQIKKVDENLVLDSEVPDNELPEGEYYIKDKKNKIHKIAIYDTIMKTDLKTLVKGQFFECPAQIFSTITDRIVQTSLNEKKAKYPEVRKVDKNMYWVLIIGIAIMGLLIALKMMGG